MPPAVLPEVCPSAGRLGETLGVPGLPDGIPITGVAGDQQAALYGQDCTDVGDAKCTYGTGAFLLMNVGAQPVLSTRGLLTTVAWTLDAGAARTTAYALEGSAFIAGALVQWLRDGLGIITQRQGGRGPGAFGARQRRGDDRPRADRSWRAALALGGARADRGRDARDHRGTHRARGAGGHRAAERRPRRRRCRPTPDIKITHLRVDGGAAANDLLMQIQADLLGVQIFRPEMVESTALGAAKLAALGIGLPPEEKGSQTARMRMFTPSMAPEKRAEMLARWAHAVERA